jgi:hypothetical protein
MTTKRFAYKVRPAKNGVTRLVAFYDKDYAQRPAAILMHADALEAGSLVYLSFVHKPVDVKEMLGA